MAQTRTAAWLPAIIRLTAVGYLLFFVPNLILATTHHINTLPPSLSRLFNWGAGGDEVAVMFSTVYIVWAIFLFRSARAPLANRLFLDFNLAANTAHFGAGSSWPSPWPTSTSTQREYSHWVCSPRSR